MVPREIIKEKERSGEKDRKNIIAAYRAHAWKVHGPPIGENRSLQKLACMKKVRVREEWCLTHCIALY